MIKKPKKRPNMQRRLRAASFMRIAKELKVRATHAKDQNLDAAALFLAVAETLEGEAKVLRAMK